MKTLSKHAISVALLVVVAGLGLATISASAAQDESQRWLTQQVIKAKQAKARELQQAHTRPVMTNPEAENCDMMHQRKQSN